MSGAWCHAQRVRCLRFFYLPGRGGLVLLDLERKTSRL